MKLKGRIALISGSSSGIGRGVALAFAREGAEGVVVNYPAPADKAAAEAVVREVSAAGAQAIAVEADVADESATKALVAEAHARFGRIDVLVNNAGIAHSAALQDTPVDIWDRVIAVHLRGTFLLTRAVLPEMYARGHGKVINTVSQLAYKGAPGLTAYTAAKGAIISLTRSLALEIGPRRINVNCVAPGATRTPILDSVTPELLEAVRAAIPRGRIAEVEEIAPTYVFLASQDANHFQGQCLSPNGGDQFL